MQKILRERKPEWLAKCDDLQAQELANLQKSNDNYNMKNKPYMPDQTEVLDLLGEEVFEVYPKEPADLWTEFVENKSIAEVRDQIEKTMAKVREQFSKRAI